MNPRIQKLYEQSWVEGSYQEPIQGELGDEQRYRTVKTCNFDHEHFAQLIVREYASEYNKLINGESVVLPKDREHAEALVRVGMFYLENNK